MLKESVYLAIRVLLFTNEFTNTLFTITVLHIPYMVYGILTIFTLRVLVLLVQCTTIILWSQPLASIRRRSYTMIILHYMSDIRADTILCHILYTIHVNHTFYTTMYYVDSYRSYLLIYIYMRPLYMRLMDRYI